MDGTELWWVTGNTVIGGPAHGRSLGLREEGGVRLATSVCRLRRDQMEQGPTEPHAGRSTFLLSSGGAGGGY